MPATSPDDTVRLFLSYGREDFDAVSDLYDRLETLGLRPWMDKRDLLPGQRWREIIPRQVQQSDLVLVCLSPQSVDKRGFFQREIRTALDAWKDKLQADIYLIPVRLAECEVPEEIGEFNWVDLYDKNGWKLLLRAIEAATKGLSRAVPAELAEELASKKKPLPQSPVEAPADQVVIVSGGARKRLQTEYWELQRQYDTLTSRISAVDTDLGRALDGEQRLVLDDRRTELAGRRNEVSARMAQIERELAEPAASERAAPPSEQKAAPPPAEVAKVEIKPKPVVQVELAPAKPAKPVEPARPDLLIIDKPLRLELVRVPAGEFLMGSDPTKDKEARNAEMPQHRLNLPEFFISKYPVTNEQYAVFVGQTQGKAPNYDWQGGKIPTGKARYPVDVSWHEANAFCDWLHQATDLGFRLPSEAEWEKAARGVDGRVYPWGNEAPTAVRCNFNHMINNITPVDVYSKGGSPFGALDMAGNVWEWTLSLWGKDVNKPQFGYPYKSTDGREDLQASVDIRRVVRGGSYLSNDSGVRCAYRNDFTPDTRNRNLGFRVVCVSAPS